LGKASIYKNIKNKGPGQEKTAPYRKAAIRNLGDPVLGASLRLRRTPQAQGPGYTLQFLDPSGQAQAQT
jgi:hypothetical protein